MKEFDQHDALDLESIMREFGSGTVPPPAPPEPETEQPEGPEEQGEELEIRSLEKLNFASRHRTAPLPEDWEPEAGDEPQSEEAPPAKPDTEPEPEAEPEAAPDEAPAVTADTIRLDSLRDIPAPVQEAPEGAGPSADAPGDTAATADTIRLDPEEVDQALEEAASPAEATEPEAEEEYEDEDEEDVVIPPPPILFRPRTRLRELKRELIAGPEKRYYELSEQGVGKLQMAIFLSMILVLLSGGAASLYAMDMVPENRMKLMVFGQILAMLLGALLGSQQLIDGIVDLFRGRFTPKTLLVCTLIACCADGVMCLREQRVPLCAAFTLEVSMSLWSSYQQRVTETGMMDSLRKAHKLSALVRREEYYDGRPAFLRTEGQVADFMKSYGQISGPEKKQNVYALLCLVFSICAAVAAFLLHDLSMALLILSTTLLVAFPASFFVSISRPMAVLERKLHSLGTVLCGWQGIQGLSGKAVFPLGDEDLFPLGSTKLNGVKFYDNHDPDQTVAYAAALMRANGGILSPVFEQLLASRNGIRYTAENVHFYGNGGIGGEVNGVPVLMGSLDFLKDMGIEIPEGTQLRQAVHVVVDGDLAGLFAINYSRMKYSVNGIATLAGYSKLKTLILAGDFMLTGPFLKEKFGVSTRRMVFPQRAEQAELLAQTAPEDAPALALTTTDGLAPAAYAVTGARALRKAWALGLFVHILGGILGVLIMLALAVLGSAHLLSPVHILMYQVVWMIPGLLATLWPRTI